MRDILATSRPRPTQAILDPAVWLAHPFSARAAAQAVVVRRKARAVERLAGWDHFRADLKRRGYRAVLNGGQAVVLCNTEPVHILD